MQVIRGSRILAAALQYQGLAPKYSRAWKIRLRLRGSAAPSNTLISAMPVRCLTGANRRVTFDRQFAIASRLAEKSCDKE
jgi:hypothetical protein